MKIKGTLITFLIASIICSSNLVNAADIKPLNNRTRNEIKLYNYMLFPINRSSTLKQALALHNGSPANDCVYFVSQTLRNTILSVPLYVNTTSELVNYLTSKGWTRGKNWNNLAKGDICFTTGDYKGNPTHSYIFMSWVNKTFTYANICDNQSYQYGTILHKRSFNFATPTKEACAFFMHSN